MKLLRYYLVINMFCLSLMPTQVVGAVFPHMLPNAACYTDLPEKYGNKAGYMCVGNPSHIDTSFPFYISFFFAVIITIVLPFPMVFLWILG